MIFENIPDGKMHEINEFLQHWAAFEGNMTNFVNRFIEVNIYNLYVDKEEPLTFAWATMVLEATKELLVVVDDKFDLDKEILARIIKIFGTGIENRALLN